MSEEIEQNTYQLTMTRDHLRALIQALTIVGRAGMGQFREMADLFPPQGDVTMYDHGERFELLAKSFLIPGLPDRSYLGIRNENTPITSKLSWEILESLTKPEYRCQGLSGLPLPTVTVVDSH